MSRAACAPVARSPSPGARARSMLARKVSAVIGAPDGGEKRRPGRMRNEYVRPSAETAGAEAAASGTRARPAAPSASG